MCAYVLVLFSLSISLWSFFAARLIHFTYCVVTVCNIVVPRYFVFSHDHFATGRNVYRLAVCSYRVYDFVFILLALISCSVCLRSFRIRTVCCHFVFLLFALILYHNVYTHSSFYTVRAHFVFILFALISYSYCLRPFHIYCLC